MANFSVTVDATRLGYSAFVIAGPIAGNYFPNNFGGNWTANTQTYTVALAPATYTFVVGSGSYDTFTFTLSSAGVISLSEGASSYVTVEGTKIIVRGFEVTVDARYITGQVNWNTNQTKRPPIVLQTSRMIPMTGYRIAMQDNCSFDFTIDQYGLFQYDSSYNYLPASLLQKQASGFLQGQGTATLVLLGYPLLIDARHAGGTGVGISQCGPQKFTTNGVVLANLLPYTNFELDFGSGLSSLASFVMDTTGSFTAKNELPYQFAFDKFDGVSRLTVNKVVLESQRPMANPEEPALAGSSR
jgi:hypothetical protein